jgi:hypothetical protein
MYPLSLKRFFIGLCGFILLGVDSCKSQSQKNQVKVDGDLSNFNFVVKIRSEKSQLCSATPIARWALLTATHCLSNHMDGGISLVDDPENKSVKVFFADSTKAREIISDPTPSKSDLRHDVVILAMSKPLIGYRIARLSGFEEFNKLESYDLFVAGYGAYGAKFGEDGELVLDHDGKQRSAPVNKNSLTVEMPKLQENGAVLPGSALISFSTNEGTSGSVLPGDSGSGLYALDSNQLPIVFGVASYVQYMGDTEDNKKNLSHMVFHFVSLLGPVFRALLAEHRVSPVEMCKDYYCIHIGTPHVVIQSVFRGLSVESFKKLWDSDPRFSNNGDSISILRSSIKQTLVDHHNLSLQNAVNIKFGNKVQSEGQTELYIHWFTERDLGALAVPDIPYSEYKGYIHVSHMYDPSPLAVIEVTE